MSKYFRRLLFWQKKPLDITLMEYWQRLLCNIPSCELCTLLHFPAYDHTWNHQLKKQWHEDFVKLYHKKNLELIER